MIRRKSRARLLAPSFLVVAGFATALVSCGEDAPATCPSAPPTDGSACRDEQLDCDYGDVCAWGEFRCQGGRWQRASAGCNPPYPLSCPEDQPEDGASCGPVGFGIPPDSCEYLVPGCGASTVECVGADGATQPAPSVTNVWRVSGCDVTGVGGAGGAPGAAGAKGGAGGASDTGGTGGAHE